MTPEQRLDRLERVAKLFVTAGLRARKQSREQDETINILISMHMTNEEAWRAESHATNENINILIHTQMETSEQIKEIGEQIKETGEQIKGLAAGQAKTDQALRGFINSLRKGTNGKSSK